MSTAECDDFDYDYDTPLTAYELAERRVDMACRDAALAMADLMRYRLDPIARHYVAESTHQLWTVKAACDLLISEFSGGSLGKLRVVK